MQLNLYRDLYKTRLYASLNVPKIPPLTITYPGAIGSNECTNVDILKKDGESTAVMCTVYGGPGLQVDIDDLEIAGARIPLPDIQVGLEHTPTKLYTDGGCRFDLSYFKFSEGSNTVYLQMPQAYIYTDIAEDGEHGISDNFQQVRLYRLSSGRPLIGSGATLQNDPLPIVISSDNPQVTVYRNIRLYAYTTDTTFKFSDGHDDVTTEALFFVVMADYDDTSGQTPVTSTALLTTYCGCYSSNIVTASDIVPVPETTTGYNPVQTTGRQAGGQGRGNGVSDPSEHMDVAARNGAFSFGGNGRGLTYYNITFDNFKDVIGIVYSRLLDLGSSILSGDLESAIDIGLTQLQNTDATRECVVSAIMLPCDAGGTVSNKVQVGYVPINCVGAKVVTGRIVDVGTFSLNLIGEGWQDYNDVLFSEVTLNLPFVGSINIDPAAVAANASSGGQISVEVYIDAYTGNISYWVYLTPMNTPNNMDYLHGVYTGNCAVDIPYAAIANAGDLKGKIRNIGTSMANGAQAAAVNFVSPGSGKSSQAALEGFV